MSVNTWLPQSPAKAWGQLGKQLSVEDSGGSLVSRQGMV